MKRSTKALVALSIGTFIITLLALPAGAFVFAFTECCQVKDSQLGCALVGILFAVMTIFKMVIGDPPLKGRAGQPIDLWPDVFVSFWAMFAVWAIAVFAWWGIPWLRSAIRWHRSPPS